MSYDFYWMSGSPNAWRAMLALEYKGIPYVSHRLDGGKGEHKTPEFLAMNPRGRVPVLKDGAFAMSESVAIMAYLERTHPDGPLFGATAEETGRIWQRVFEVVNDVLSPIDNGIVRPVFRGNGPSGEAVAAVHDALGWMNVVLEASPYLAGTAVSAADLTVIPNIQLLARVGRREDTRELRLDKLEAAYPHVATWIARIEALPAYDRSYPPHWRTG